MGIAIQNTGVGACDKGKIKHNEIIANAESAPFLINALCPLSVTFHPIAGSTGKVASTTGTRAQVEAGTAVWTDWPAGSVGADTTQIIDSPVTALKLIKTGGATCAWDIVG